MIPSITYRISHIIWDGIYFSYNLRWYQTRSIEEENISVKALSFPKRNSSCPSAPLGSLYFSPKTNQNCKPIHISVTPFFQFSKNLPETKLVISLMWDHIPLVSNLSVFRILVPVTAEVVCYMSAYIHVYSLLCLIVGRLRFSITNYL